MQTDDLILPLIVALWGCTNLVFSTTKHLNELRNSVLDGVLNEPPLSREQMRLIIYSDWLPISLCTGLVCIGFSIVAFLSPFLLKPEERTTITLLISAGVALFSAIMGVIWIPAGIADWRAMQAIFQASPKPQETAEQSHALEPATGPDSNGKVTPPAQ